MKRLIFSDLHLHVWPYGSTTDESGFNSRLLAQYRAAQEMIEYAVEHNIKYVYFGGDLTHLNNNIPTQVLWCAHHIFRSLRQHGILVRSIVGNHDFGSREGKINSLEFIKYMNDELSTTSKSRNSHSTLDRVEIWRDDGLRVVALPYTQDEDQIKRFLEFAGNTEEKTMVLLHQGVAGVPMASGFVLDERLSPDMIPDNVSALTGHYHKHQRVSQNLTVIGSLTSNNWNDIDQKKGWVIFDDETGQIEQVIQTKAPEFRLVRRLSEEVGNVFARVGRPVSVKHQEEVRQELLKAGALTVEFTETDESDKETQAFVSGEEATLSHLVESFEKKDMEPRRRVVGQQIREGAYVRP